MKFSPLACFCNYSTLFLIFSLIADAIYDFFSDGGSYFFHSSIKSTLFAVKDLFSQFSLEFRVTFVLETLKMAKSNWLRK